MYLQRNINSDLLTSKNAPAGTYTAVVSFIVDADGNLSNLKAEKMLAIEPALKLYG